MGLDYWNEEQMRRVLEQMVSKCREVHEAAGHTIDRSAQGVGIIECDCGLVISFAMRRDSLFGWVHQVVVHGRGKPFYAQDIDTLRDITYGTHPEFGIAEKISAIKHAGHVCPNCGK